MKWISTLVCLYVEPRPSHLIFLSCHRPYRSSLLIYIIVSSPSSCIIYIVVSALSICIIGPTLQFSSLLVHLFPISVLWLRLLSGNRSIHRLWRFHSPVFPCPILSHSVYIHLLCLLYPLFLLAISWSTTSFSSICYIFHGIHYPIFSIELHTIH